MKTKIHLGSRKFISPSQILSLEAIQNYTLIHFTDGTKLLSSTNLGTIEKRLNQHEFFRANRSIIINLEYLSHFIIHTKASKFKAATNANPEIIISRRRLAAFEACINA